MHLRITLGTTGLIVRLHLRAATGARIGRTGLRFDTPDLSAAFLRAGDARPTPIPLRDPVGDAHVPGGFREIDRDAMPGLYDLHIPDDVLAGPGRAVIMLLAPDTEPSVIHVDLVAYDPYDAERLGLTCLSQESRHECLASAFESVIPPIVDRCLTRST